MPGSMNSHSNMVDGNQPITSLSSLFRALEAQMTLDRLSRVADTQNRTSVPGFFQAGQMPATSFGNLVSGPPAAAPFPDGLGLHSAKPNLNSIHGNFFPPFNSPLLSHASPPHWNGAGQAGGTLTGLGARLDQPTAVYSQSQAATVLPQLNVMRTDQQPGRPAARQAWAGLDIGTGLAMANNLAMTGPSQLHTALSPRQAAPGPPAASLQQSATQKVTWTNSSEYMRPKNTPEQAEEAVGNTEVMGSKPCSPQPLAPPPDRVAASQGSSKGKAASTSVPFEDNGQLAQLSQQGRAGAAETDSRPRTSRACVVCRQGKKKCDYGRPCRTCIMRGMAQQCVDEPKAVACFQCHRRRLKCDRQRPCARCAKLGQGDACCDPPLPTAESNVGFRQIVRKRPLEDKTEAGEADSNDERPALTDERYSSKRKKNAALVASSASPQGEGREFVVPQAMTACGGGSSPTRRASHAFAPADGRGKTLARGGSSSSSSSSSTAVGGKAASDSGGMLVRPSGIEPQFEQQFQAMITMMSFQRGNASKMVRDILAPITHSSFPDIAHIAMPYIAARPLPDQVLMCVQASALEAGIKLAMQQHQCTNATTNSLYLDAANGEGDEGGGSGQVGRRKRKRVRRSGASIPAGEDARAGESGRGGGGGKCHRRMSISAEEAISELKAVVGIGIGASSSDEEMKDTSGDDEMGGQRKMIGKRHEHPSASLQRQHAETNHTHTPDDMDMHIAANLGVLAAMASRPMTASNQYSLVVHRPFHFHTVQDISSTPNRGEILQALNACFREGLFPNPFVRFFEAGWCISSVMRLFTALPPEVKSAVDDILDTIQTLAFAHRLLAGAAPTGQGGAARRVCVSPHLIEGSASSTQSAPAGSWRDKEKANVLPASGGGDTAKNEQSEPSSTPLVVVVGAGVVEVGSVDMNVEVQVGRPSQRFVISVEDMKQEDEEEAFVNHIRALTEKHKMTQTVGVYSFEWDPVTGSRQKIRISETLCNLLDMHTEELIARVGACEHMLANTEMEVLSILVNEITSLGLISERCGRVVLCDPITRKLKRQFLVRHVALREMDSLGRIVRTIHLIDRITPEQYDEYCREKQTKNGRNVLWEEDRTGAELVDDAGKDYLFDETLASRTQDPVKIADLVSRIRARTQNLQKLIEGLHHKHHPFKESNSGTAVLPSSLSNP